MTTLPTLCNHGKTRIRVTLPIPGISTFFHRNDVRQYYYVVTQVQRYHFPLFQCNREGKVTICRATTRPKLVPEKEQKYW